MTAQRRNGSAGLRMPGVAIAGQLGVELDADAHGVAANLAGSLDSPSSSSVGYSSASALSPMMLSVRLIAIQSLLIVLCSMLPAVFGEGDGGAPDYSEALVGGLGVALMFAVIRPMIRFSTARHNDWALFSVSVPGTMVALAMAELAGLGSYAYLDHFFGTTVPPVSFHHWLRAWAAAAAGVSLVDIIAGRVAARWVQEGRMARRIVVFGGGEHGHRFIADAKARWPTRLMVTGYFDDRMECSPVAIAGVPYLGGAEQLIDYVRSERIEEIVIALPWADDQRIKQAMRRLRHMSVPIRLAPDLFMLDAASQRSRLESFYTITISDRPVSEWGLLVKRQFDWVCGAALLALALPTMAAIACLIKLDSPGPVLFRQKRLGFNNQPFDVLKFRTMTHGGSSGADKRQAQRGDRRVTKVGKFLRRSSLDELPQLFNVLRGEMSLVGPRPHPIWSRADELWPDQGDRPLDSLFSEYACRHRMKPGITGWAQVCGYRGETETPDKMAKRVEHDIYYIDNWSLWFDLQILSKTIATALLDKNAY